MHDTHRQDIVKEARDSCSSMAYKSDISKEVKDGITKLWLKSVQTHQYRQDRQTFCACTGTDLNMANVVWLPEYKVTIERMTVYGFTTKDSFVQSPHVFKVLETKEMFSSSFFDHKKAYEDWKNQSPCSGKKWQF